ncbi:MAG: hypothetical protein QME81_03560 [bacterium]|nr:hypothetical protein [bacterium]
MLKRKILLILVFLSILILETGCGNKDSGTSPGNNQPPVIDELKAGSSQLEVGAETTLTCVANDVDGDGDSLTYTWFLNDKALPDTGPSISWTAPMDDGTYRIAVVVSDGEEEDRKEIEITVTDNRAVYNPAEYFPLGEGDSWTYRESEMEEPDVETTYIIRGKMEINGVMAVKMAKEDDTSSYDLYTNTGGIKWLGFKYDEPFQGVVSEGYWDLPPGLPTTEARIGDQIEIKTFVYSMDGVPRLGPFYVTITLKGPEDVSTPAGFFADCLLIEVQFHYPYGGTNKDTRWLAKGVGLVKERAEVVDESGETVWWWEESVLIDYKVGGMK